MKYESMSATAHRPRPFGCGLRVTVNQRGFGQLGELAECFHSLLRWSRPPRVILSPQAKDLGRGASGSHEVRVDVSNSAPPQTLRLRPQGDSKSARIRTVGETG